jgi:hypothetical protein
VRREVFGAAGAEKHYAHVSPGRRGCRLVQICAVAVVLSPLNACGIGATTRAHHEEAVLHSLLDNQSTFESILDTAHKRGYQCADQAILNADQTPIRGGRNVTCSKHMDLNLPPLACSWSVSVEKTKSESIDQFDIWSLRACN